MYYVYISSTNTIVVQLDAKNKRRVDTDSINNNNLQNGHGHSNESITNWRDSIKLSKTNDVLVAFAWAHDDEVKNT